MHCWRYQGFRTVHGPRFPRPPPGPQVGEKALLRGPVGAGQGPEAEHKLVITWQESTVPCRYPAQIMAGVMRSPYTCLLSHRQGSMSCTIAAFSPSEVFPATEDGLAFPGSLDSLPGAWRDPPRPSSHTGSWGTRVSSSCWGLCLKRLQIRFWGRLPASGAGEPHLCPRVMLSRHPATWFPGISFPPPLLPLLWTVPRATRGALCLHLKHLAVLNPTRSSTLTTRPRLPAGGNFLDARWDLRSLSPGCYLDVFWAPWAYRAEAVPLLEGSSTHSHATPSSGLGKWSHHPPGGSGHSRKPPSRDSSPSPC